MQGVYTGYASKAFVFVACGAVYPKPDDDGESPNPETMSVHTQPYYPHPLR